MRMSSIFGGLAAVVLATAAIPAAAVEVTSTSTSGGNAVKPFELSSSQISTDFDIFAFTQTTVTFGVQTGDAATYNFDSLVSIFTGVGPAAQGVNTLVLGLTNGATFNLGTVAASFSNATTSLNAAGDTVTISFSPSETFAATLGSADTTAGDFGINRNGLAAGQSFALTVNATAVPEPAAWLMLISGFGVIGAGLRHNRRSLQASHA
jgi:hypothetical protein